MLSTLHISSTNYALVLYESSICKQICVIVKIDEHGVGIYKTSESKVVSNLVANLV